MAAEQLNDEEETLVVAMTRPTMISGFTLTSLVLSFYLPFMVAMLTRSVLAFLLVPILLVISYLVCLKDVYLFDICAAATRLKICVNKRIWGVRRYAPR